MANQSAKRAAQWDRAQSKLGDKPFQISVSGSASNEAKAALGGKSPYLAQLLRGGERRWAPKAKRGAAGHPVMMIDAAIGDVVEFRVAWWNGEATLRRTGWAIVGGDGELHALDRDEAVRLAAGALPGPDEPTTLPSGIPAERMLPGCITIFARETVA